MLRLDGSEGRSFLRTTTLALTLSLVAGAVNASGLLAAGAMTSHMTGNLTRVGEGLALGSVDAFDPARCVLAFLAGAFIATLATRALVRRGLREPIPTLLLIEAVLLSIVAMAGWFATRPLLVTELLCLSMGWQNALITRISGAVVRTTHVTGTMTDLGIELGHLVIERPRVLHAVRMHGLTTYLRDVSLDSDVARAAIHLTTIVCFLIGATSGPLLFVRYGYRAMIAPAMVLALLVALNRAFPRSRGKEGLGAGSARQESSCRPSETV
jgi:uncharacterized membrane protein YoaK (UPF0700 family)